MALLPASILPARTEKGYEVLQRQTGDSRNPLPDSSLRKDQGIFQSQSDARRRYAPAQQGDRILSAPMDNGKDTEILLRPSRRNAELLDSRLRHPPLLRSKEGADTRHLQLDRYGSTSQRKRIRTGFPLHPSPVRPSPAAHRTARKMETGRFIDRGFPEGSRRLSGSGTGDRGRRTGTGQPQTTGKRPATGRQYPLYRSRL